MIHIQTKYLTNMPTEILNEYGLNKTLITRRETIYLKHILKNVFIYGNEKDLLQKLEMLQFKSLFEYMGFITNKIRAIYKIPRQYIYDSSDRIVKQRRESFIDTLDLYKSLNPIIILDFDKTITNAKFHTLYKYFKEMKFKIIVNSANPQKEIIKNYFDKNDLQQPEIIYSNKGKQRKITRLKNIVIGNMNKPIFYIDDEIEYLQYGVLLGCYCYQYTKNGKIKNYTGFLK